MVPFGGPGVMLLVVIASALVLVVIALLSGRRVGWDKVFTAAAFVWTLSALFIITLVPAYGPPGLIPADQAQSTCSWDYGGPAPDGFWIFSGGQRLLNVLVFVPAGVLLVVALSRWRRGLRWVLPGVVMLVGCSVLIETVQLELTRIGRSCDITDVIDNSTGAAIGALVGMVVVGVLRLTRRAPRVTEHR